MVVTLLYANERVFRSNGKNRATSRGRVFPCIIKVSTPLIPLSTSPSLLLITFLRKVTSVVLLMPQNAQILHDSKAHLKTVTCAESFSTRKRFPMVPTAKLCRINDVILLKSENASFSIIPKVESAM